MEEAQSPNLPSIKEQFYSVHTEHLKWKKSTIKGKIYISLTDAIIYVWKQTIDRIS